MRILVVLSTLMAIISAKPINENPHIYGSHFEGDIILSPEQVAVVNATGINRRTGLFESKYHWPKKDGFVSVPIVFDSVFSVYDQLEILTGIKIIQDSTCIRFVKRRNEKDYIQFISDQGCYSQLGRQGGRQNLSLQVGVCVTYGTAIHEVIHALGYTHMQNHFDRDTMVKIHWENIKKGVEYNFAKVDKEYFDNFGTPYDISSIMHYSSYAFSKNGKQTITALDPANRDKIGGSELTRGDITRLRNMYQCDD